MLRVILFAVLSAPLAYVSRKPLRVPGSHGFYRFFAWECILGLGILNLVSLRQWFGDPFSTRQLASWILLFGSIVPAVWGTYLLRNRGKPDARQEHDGAALRFERTTQLVTTGVYGYIRHPLYCSLLLLAWGVFLKRPSWPGAVSVLGATAFLIATARVEELENVRYFGAAYQVYMRRTRMFIPFLL